MTPELGRYTKPCEFKGRNELGKLLNEIASDIRTQYLTKSQNQLLTALNTSNTTMTSSIVKAVSLLSNVLLLLLTNMVRLLQPLHTARIPLWVILFLSHLRHLYSP